MSGMSALGKILNKRLDIRTRVQHAPAVFHEGGEIICRLLAFVHHKALIVLVELEQFDPDVKQQTHQIVSLINYEQKI